MRLTAFILLTSCLAASAGGRAQTIKLDVKNAPLEKVFSEIKKQSGYSFVYYKEDLAKGEKITLRLTSTNIEEVLQQVLKDQPLNYKIVDHTIVIAKKEDKTGTGAVILSGDEGQAPPPIDITGKVTDADGNPLSGATVKVKGGSKGTTTNSDGVFVLKGVDDNATLEISFVGYETYIVAVNNKTSIVANLKVKPESLNEVIINKGYYSEKQRNSVANVGTVTAKDIEKQPVNNVLLALEGRVPGLFITQSSGLAGSGVTVRIQGQNSIGRGSDPLYVVDGVPYTSQTLPTLNFILGSSGNAGASVPAGSGNPLSFINPSDIESIDVLKDADATAIYGSRAAAGAILITTKKGKAGQTRVNINLQNGWGKVTRKLDLLNTQQYIQMRHEALNNDNLAVDATDYDINGVWDTTRYTDWQKELLGGTSKYQDAQTSVSGGNSSVQYLIGGAYHKETTVFPDDFADQKGSMHFDINSISSNERFKVQLSGSYLVDNNKLPAIDLTQQALQLAPDAPSLYNTDGSLNWALLPNGNSTFNNPIGNYTYAKYQDKTSNLLANSVVSYQIITGLELKANFGFTRLQNDEVQTNPFASISPPSRAFSQRTSQFGHGLINSWILEPQATYSHRFGKGQLQTLLGTTFQKQNNNLQQLTATGFNSDLVMYDIKSASSITPYATVIADYKYSALFGRLNYNWSDKYILNLTGRRDGSSRFGSENLFHNFWSIAGGWIFTSEKIVEQGLPIISFGKLRASYGTTGNDQIGDYQFLNRYNAVGNVQVPYQGVTSIAPAGLPNPYIQWEETKKLQFGLDLGFVKDRILVSANYNRNRSSNQLLSYSLPTATGTGSIITNFPATIENSAWEFSVNTDNIHSGNFRWISNFNLTIPKNELVAFPNIATSSYSSSLIVGQPFTIQLLYHFMGVDPAKGAYVFSDSKGNVTLSPKYPADATSIINTSPRFYGGMQNSISYKGFELSFLFQFTKQIGSNYAFGFLPGMFNLNQPDYVLSRWQKPGDASAIQRYNSNFDLYNAHSNVTSISDGVWEDASYIRLKNLSLSWQLPSATLQKLHLKNLRVYTQGQNLLTITNYKGLDPENLSTNSLPMLRVITVGLQVTL